jgi:hypothetical protein
MLINEVKYDEKKTQVIPMNITSVYYEPEFMDYRYDNYKDLNQPHPESKDFLKDLLGKQQICKNYSVRNWIWTLSTEDKSTTIHLLASKRGISFEYNINSDETKLKSLFYEFMEVVHPGLEIKKPSLFQKIKYFFGR